MKLSPCLVLIKFPCWFGCSKCNYALRAVNLRHAPPHTTNQHHNLPQNSYVNGFMRHLHPGALHSGFGVGALCLTLWHSLSLVRRQSADCRFPSWTIWWVPCGFLIYNIVYTPCQKVWFTGHWDGGHTCAHLIAITHTPRWSHQAWKKDSRMRSGRKGVNFERDTCLK